MQNRAYNRISVQLDAMYYCGIMIYSGIVTNISENGLFMHTKLDFPFHINFEMIMPSNKGILNFPVKLTRLEKFEGIYNGIGVQISAPPQSYLDYISNLRASIGSIG